MPAIHTRQIVSCFATALLAVLLLGFAMHGPARAAAPDACPPARRAGRRGAENGVPGQRHARQGAGADRSQGGRSRPEDDSNGAADVSQDQGPLPRPPGDRQIPDGQASIRPGGEGLRTVGRVRRPRRARRRALPGGHLQVRAGKLRRRLHRPPPRDHRISLERLRQRSLLLHRPMPFQARPLGQGHRSHGAGGHERAGRHQGRGLRGGRAAALHQGRRQEPGRPQYRQGQGQGPRQRQERRRGRSRAGPLRKERRVLAGLDPDRTRRAGPRRRPPANHRRRRGDRELHQSLYLRGKGQSTSPRPRPHGLDRLDRLHGRGVSPVRPGGFRRSAGLSPRQGHEPQREQGPGADHRQSLLALQGAARTRRRPPTRRPKRTATKPATPSRPRWWKPDRTRGCSPARWGCAC